MLWVLVLALSTGLCQSLYLYKAPVRLVEKRYWQRPHVPALPYVERYVDRQPTVDESDVQYYKMPEVSLQTDQPLGDQPYNDVLGEMVIDVQDPVSDDLEKLQPLSLETLTDSQRYTPWRQPAGGAPVYQEQQMVRGPVTWHRSKKDSLALNGLAIVRKVVQQPSLARGENRIPPPETLPKSGDTNTATLTTATSPPARTLATTKTPQDSATPALTAEKAKELLGKLTQAKAHLDRTMPVKRQKEQAQVPGQNLPLANLAEGSREGNPSGDEGDGKERAKGAAGKHRATNVKRAAPPSLRGRPRQPAQMSAAQDAQVEESAKVMLLRQQVGALIEALEMMANERAAFGDYADPRLPPRQPASSEMELVDQAIELQHALDALEELERSRVAPSIDQQMYLAPGGLPPSLMGRPQRSYPGQYVLEQS